MYDTIVVRKTLELGVIQGIMPRGNKSKGLKYFVVLEKSKRFFNENEIFRIVVYNILIDSNFEINTFGLPSLLHISPSNPCEKCDFYKKIKNLKEPYIGDSPCQWCTNNPFKIS